MSNWDRVPRQKPISPIISGSSELALPWQRLEIERLGMKAKVLRSQRGCLLGWLIGPANASITPAIRSIDPVVEAPIQPIHQKLLVAQMKTGEHHPLVVSDAIAVCIFEVQYVGRGRDKNAAAIRKNARWE